MKMFRSIGHQIAMRFTAFVFLLLLINGAVFLAADFSNAHRQSRFRLAEILQRVTERPWVSLDDVVRALPPPARERIRIVDPMGNAFYAGPVFDDFPFEPVEGQGFSDRIVAGEHYNVLTAPIYRNGKLEGYIQVAEVQRFQEGDLPFRSFLYLLVSLAISALTYFVGLLFARSSLRPAADAMSRLEQFTQDASHELRTPLAMLNSSLDLALKSGKHEEGLLSAKDDVKSITLLIKRLLDLTRLDTLTLQERKIDLSSLVHQAVDRHRPLAEKRNVRIESTLKEGVRVRADEPLIRQVLANLLSNATKFNKEGGTIRVALTDKTLVIEDTGIGIAPDVLPQIFERFYQADTSRAKEGFGLGLSLVKRIVDLHGWTIAARSEPGKGSTFTVGIRP